MVISLGFGRMGEAAGGGGLRCATALFSLVGLGLAGTEALAQAGARLELGRLSTGDRVAFAPAADGSWGMEIERVAGPALRQPQPARIEVYHTGDGPNELLAGYDSVAPSEAGSVIARATLRANGGTVFTVEDRWHLDGAVVSVRRAINVDARPNASGSGFNSGVEFVVDPSVAWTDLACFAPGALYGNPTHNGERSPGGTRNHEARRFVIREDYLPAPVFALSFRDGASVAVLDPEPRGDSTMAETQLREAVMIDQRFQFGALGAWQEDGAPVEFGFRFPGTMSIYPGPATADTPPQSFRRYHPLASGVTHTYTVSFRFGVGEAFPQATRAAWRWAWEMLEPTVHPIDVEQMRQVLIDHLAAQAASIDGRTAIPFVLSTVSDTLQWNWTMVAMGFVGKNLECADLLLREAERATGERRERLREIGLGIISSLIKALPTAPLEGTGYDLATGEAWDHIWVAPWLRNATEDMRVLVQTYQRERKLGREHPEWFAWVKTYVDWLLEQQREDGSFPRRWERGSDVVAEETGTTSYAPVPLLVLMTEETGDPRYQEAAERAADYVWRNWGAHGLFIGGASDNPNITDKEAGMLSLEAFLSLYEATIETKWLDRARAAADFTETWMWIWNLPMPLDAADAELNYKRGVSTIGPQGISALHAGSVDQYLAWSVPTYARLHQLTGDGHYLDVAKILLHGTKSMVALPGRQYDLKGIGWQQEGWRFRPGGAGRGTSGHRFWLPWVSANHLAGILGLDDLDPELRAQVIDRP